MKTSNRPIIFALTLGLTLAAWISHSSLLSQQERDEEQQLAGGYYNATEFSAYLLLNNKGPDPLEVRLLLRDMEGRALNLNPVFVGGSAWRKLDLRSLILETSADPAFLEGSLRVSHSGEFLELGAQVQLVDPQAGLAFHRQLTPWRAANRWPDHPNQSSRVEGLWWKPRADSELRLILSNDGLEAIRAKIWLADSERRDRVVPVKLNAGESEVVRISELRRDLPSAGGISVEYSGHPGSLHVFGLAMDTGLRYSSTIEFVDPLRAQSSRLHGEGLRAGSSSLGSMLPILVLRNVGDEPSRVNVSLPVTHKGETAVADLEEIRIQPGEVRTLSREILDSLHQALGSLEFEAGGIEIDYSGKPGSLLAAAQSVSVQGDHVFRLPLQDPESHYSSAGGYPWDLQDGATTVFYVKNLTSEVQWQLWHLTFDGGRYSPGYTTIEPGATAAVDIRQLRDLGVPDRSGRVIPPDAEQGQIYWSKFHGRGVTLSARVEQINPRGYSGSYSCENCCPDKFLDGRVTPSFISGFVGDPPIEMVPEQLMENCYGNSGEYEPVPDVMTRICYVLDSGVIVCEPDMQATCVGAGTTTLYVEWAYQLFTPPPSCYETEEGWYEVQVPVTVQPTVSITGPSMMTVGNPSIQLQTVTNPSGGAVSNWRVTNGDPECVELNSNGSIRGFAPGTVQVQVDYTLNGQTATSPPFPIMFNAAPQYVRIEFTAAADAVLQAYFTNSADRQYIMNRVNSDVSLLLGTRPTANVIIGAPPPNTAGILVRVQGAGTGGHCGFDLMNRSRGAVCEIHIGAGSLDLANHMVDPVTSTAFNERRNRDRVADAIARLAAHEAGHALGLVASSAELNADGLAGKLNVRGLLNGTTSHHNPTQAGGLYLMYFQADTALDRTWNILLYDFVAGERTYLDRILP